MFPPPCCLRCRWSCRPWNWQSIGLLIGFGIAVERVGVGGGARRRDRLHGRNRLHRAARHLRLLSPARVAGSGAEAHALERLRVLPILGSHFHHDEVLVELVVNGRHGALAEGIVQHVVDLVRCKAVARPGGAIHVDEQLQAVLLQVRVDIRERGGVLAERGHEPRHPFIYRVGIVAGQRVLIFGCRLAAADAQVLGCLQIEPGAGHGIELGPQTSNHLRSGQLALCQGL